MAGIDERRERARRYSKAADFARALEMDRSLLSRYETGASEVPDDRAEQIAELLGLGIIEVRRGLGLWVPPEQRDTPTTSGRTLQDVIDDEEDPYVRDALIALQKRAAERDALRRQEDDPRDRTA